jgi:serine/threonine-protein kinase
VKKQPEIVRDYIICEELGRGRTGRVYRALHKPTTSTVALKIFWPDVSAKWTGQKRRHMKARFHCPLRHENIVQCYDFFVAGDQCYLATEYVDGFNLRHCIDQAADCLTGRKPPFRHLLNTALKICRGMIYLHDQKIVHGHIKPEHILVSRDVVGPSEDHTQVKIADFLMAGSIRGLFRSSVDMKGGTVRYMAPEQSIRKRATYQSDIFSLGITFYELFTGCHPWNGSAGPKELVAKILAPTHRPVPLSQAAPSLPRQLDGVVMRMLEKEEQDRPPNMVEVWLGLSNVESSRI